EAISLIRTFVSNEDHNDLFIYEVLLPLSPDAFFKDPMLSLYLYNTIGPDAYSKKKERLIYPAMPENISEVTRKFTEGFISGHEAGVSGPPGGIRRASPRSGRRADPHDVAFA